MSWVPPDEGNLGISPFDANIIILSGWISQVTDTSYQGYSYIASTDFGQTWYGHPADSFTVIDYEFLSSDSIIFLTDKGRYLSSDAGRSPTIIDTTYSSTIHFDWVDEQLYYSSRNTVFLSHPDNLSQSILLGTFAHEVIGLYGVSFSDSLYICTTSHVFIYHGSSIDTIYSLPEIPLGTIYQEDLIDNFKLHANYPNPFNPVTTIAYELPEDAHVTLVIYDIMGHEVIRLVEGAIPAGFRQVVWSGKDHRGRDIPTGLYIARMVTPGYTNSIKMVLMK
jgi:hypothetical protein